MEIHSPFVDRETLFARGNFLRSGKLRASFVKCERYLRNGEVTFEKKKKKWKKEKKGSEIAFVKMWNSTFSIPFFIHLRTIQRCNFFSIRALWRAFSSLCRSSSPAYPRLDQRALVSDRCSVSVFFFSLSLSRYYLIYAALWNTVNIRHSDRTLCVYAF